MVWFTNEKKIQELANNLANLHVKFDNLKRKNNELEDKISNLDIQLTRLQVDNRNLKIAFSENFKKSVTTFPATPSLVDHSNIVTNANIVSTVVPNPYSTNDIISSSSYASSYDCAYSSDSSSCSDSSSSCSSD
jgi:peptidoglycan hydrolase CwlO-like protein